MLHYDHDSTIAALHRLEQEATGVMDHHRAQRPQVPPGALGRDFQHIAARFHTVLERIHAAGEKRVAEIHESSVASVAQIAELTRADESHATAYSGRRV